MPSLSEVRSCLLTGPISLVPEYYRFDRRLNQSQSTLVPVSEPPRIPAACASTALKI
jgi:hypothetical protein